MHKLILSDKKEIKRLETLYFKKFKSDPKLLFNPKISDSLSEGDDSLSSYQFILECELRIPITNNQTEDIKAKVMSGIKSEADKARYKLLLSEFKVSSARDLTKNMAEFFSEELDKIINDNKEPK